MVTDFPASVNLPSDRRFFVAVFLLFFFLGLAGCTQPIEGSQPVKIGALLPLSGKNAVYGIEIKNAIVLATEEINAKGGINGKPLEVVFEDDAEDATVGVAAMQKLAAVDQVPVVLGPWVSGVALAVAPVAEKNKVVLLAIAIAPALSGSGEYIFRIQPSAVLYTQKSAEFLREKNIRSAGILFANNDFGKGLKDSFVKDFSQNGGEVIAIESYAAGDADFRSQLAKIKEKKPEIVFIAGYQDTINAIRQMKELGMESQILAGPPFESQATIDALGPLAEGVWYPYHFVAGSSNPKAQAYEQAYLKKFGVPTGGFAPLMYDGTHIVANALEKCGEKTDCIKEQLYRTRYEGASGAIQFDSNGDPELPIVMKTVKNGKFELYQP